MKPSYAVGVDLGGTNLKIGVVKSDGKVETHSSVPVGNDKSAERIVALIAKNVAAMQKKIMEPVAGCGCGVPGIVDFEKGTVYNSPNYPLWTDVEILKLLKKQIRIPVIVDNDANMFALAELLHGAGRGRKNLIVMTLGSGIGGGIIIEGKVIHGDRGFAGEVGHIIVEPDGAKCGCGGRGCLEQYAASRAFANLVERLPKKERDSILSRVDHDPGRLTAQFAAELANEGNIAAKELWRFFGRYLGIGIASLINTLGITTIVIGGGIARSWDLFIDAVRAEIMSRTYRKNAEQLKLLQASLGEFTGIVGAASAVFQKNNHRGHRGH